MVFHGAAKFFFGKSIEDVFRSEPCAASLQDAVLDLLEVRSMVSVGIDHDFDAAVACHAQVDVVEVEPVRVGVQLHRDLILGGGLQHRFEIELVCLATQLQAARRMTEDGDVLVADGA